VSKERNRPVAAASPSASPVSLAILIFAACLGFPAALHAQSASPSASPSQAPSPAADTGPALQIAVVGLRSDRGRVSCDLFNDPAAWPRGDQFRHVWAAIHKDSATCVFKDVPAGRYAVVVYHDENSSGHFEENAFGMPLEGYGFSNDAAPLFDAPSFAASSFEYDGKRLYTVINIRY
jgi:uncharacterized protein (DUF2141 family)